MKRPTLSRDQYDAEIKQLISQINGIGPEQFSKLMAEQYPKTGVQARAELDHRGLAAPELPGDRQYSQADVDLLAHVLDAIGYHTHASEMAAAFGVSLTEYREGLADE